MVLGSLGRILTSLPTADRAASLGWPVVAAPAFALVGWFLLGASRYKLAGPQASEPGSPGSP
jgi:hypothetical protein